MDATQLLRDDHKEIRGLITQFEATKDRAPEMRAGVARELLMLLEVHDQLECEIFYVEVRSRLSDLGELATLGMTDDAMQAHEEIRALVRQARTALEGKGGLALDAPIGELGTSVIEHLEDEEARLLMMAERVLGDRLEVLGKKLEERRRELVLQDKYRDARPEVTQNPSGGEQMRKAGDLERAAS